MPEYNHPQTLPVIAGLLISLCLNAATFASGASKAVADGRATSQMGDAATKQPEFSETDASNSGSSLVTLNPMSADRSNEDRNEPIFTATGSKIANSELSSCTTLLYSNQDGVRFRCEVNDLTFVPVEVDGEIHSAVSITGEPTTYFPGKPVLPAVTKFVVVSPNSNLELEVTANTPRRVAAETPPLLLQVEEGETAECENVDGIFPPVLAEMGDPFVIRGVRMVKVTTYPVRYDSNSNEYLQYDAIEAEVRSVAGEAVNPSLHPNLKHRSREFLSFISDFAINGDQIGRDDPDRDVTPPYAGHYLIAMRAECLPYTKRFIEWRRKAGYKVDILPISSNDGTNDGRIKQLIQGVYDSYVDNGEDPFEYLLLIGDRSNYENAPAAQWVLESPTGVSNWPNARHGEYEYACLDGNDGNPDVAWGRWPSGSQAPLELAVGRTLMYEATPDMDHQDWFTRGAVYSQHWGNGDASAWHTSIASNVRWGTGVLQQLGFEDIRYYEEFDWDRYGTEIGPWLRECFNDRTNLMIGRAELYYWTTRNGQGQHNFSQEINDNTVFPVNVSCSGHGEWGAETMFRTGSGDHLKGYVTTTNGWGGAPTQPWNFYWQEMVSGILQKDLTTGWSFNRALNMIERYFPRNFQVNGRDGFLLTRTDLNHFGDPGLKPWLGVPRVVEMDFTQTIASDTKLAEVFVHIPDSDEPVAGANVTLYAPGNLPENAAQYAQYTDLMTKFTTTDQNGMARFVLTGDEEFVNSSVVYFTVTGRDIKPEFGEVTVGAPAAVIDLGGWDLEEVAGNGDEFINPGETFTLGLTAANLGRNGDLQDVYASVVSLSPYIEVEDHNPVYFGDITHGEDAGGDARITIHVSWGCPDAIARPVMAPILEVHFNSGETEYKSALKLETRAPHLEFKRCFVGNSPTIIVPDSLVDIDIELTNIGSIASPDDLIAELYSRGQGITVVENGATYDAIGQNRVGRLAGGARFSISGNKVVVPGSLTKVMFVLRTNDAILDTTFFDLQVMRPRDRAPIGPDAYGYICFDDTDTSWDVAPEYEWIEINPNANDADFDGTLVSAHDSSEANSGESKVVDLEFETQFYGQVFDQITVSNMGFIGMGSQPIVGNYQRWPMDEPTGGAAGCLAPFWNDLRFGQGSGIYFYHDTTDSKAIIEYSRMRFASGNDEATFQVILYDRSVWITESGDQNIVFQYKTISNPANIRNGDQEWVNNMPYASVGISAPNGRSGINYTWGNAYPTGAAELAARRAIFFTTSPRFRSGILYGYVTDFANGLPIEGATVYTKHGFIAITDADGYWRIAEALAGVPFDITARKQGYNDSTYTELLVEENDSLEVLFDILHPEFSISTDFINANLQEGQNVDLDFLLANTGNGPLDWSAEKRLIGDANAAPWQLRRNYQATEITGDDRIEGVIFAENRFFLSGANGNDPNMIYSIDRDGALVDSFEQVGSSRYGYKDMDWDGELIWAPGQDSIYAFTTEGEYVIGWPDPLNPSQYVAYNRDDNTLFLSGTTTNIIRCDREGNVLEGGLNRLALRIYGISYWPEDPDGSNLYIVDRPNGSTSRVTKMNTETNDTTTVYMFPENADATGQQSAWITNEFDVYSWVLMSINNISNEAGGDRIDIHQLDARKDWMNLDTWAGRLETGEFTNLVMTYDATGLPDTLFEGELLFRHNADDGEMRVSLELQVMGPRPPDAFGLALPADGDTLTALPLHGDTLRLPEVTFAWHPSHDPNMLDYLDYALTITAADSSVHFLTADTSLTLNLDTLGLPIWFDMPLVWSVTVRSADDQLDCEAPFRLNIIANDIDREEALTPAEFALQAVYPNPFNAVVSIKFSNDRAAATRLALYDMQGREAATLYQGKSDIGSHFVSYNAAALSSGIYILRLESEDRVKTMKVALVK